MKFGKAGQVCKIIDVDVFGTVIGDIFADIHKFLDIFMLLAGSDTGKSLAGIKIGAPYGHEEADHQGIDQGFGKRHFIVIFTADLK